MAIKVAGSSSVMGNDESQRVLTEFSRFRSSQRQLQHRLVEEILRHQQLVSGKVHALHKRKGLSNMAGLQSGSFLYIPLRRLSLARRTASSVLSPDQSSSPDCAQLLSKGNLERKLKVDTHCTIIPASSSTPLTIPCSSCRPIVIPLGINCGTPSMSPYTYAISRMISLDWHDFIETISWRLTGT
jgi:hypothetical protein